MKGPLAAFLTRCASGSVAEGLSKGATYTLAQRLDLLTLALCTKGKKGQKAHPCKSARQRIARNVACEVSAG